MSNQEPPGDWYERAFSESQRQRRIDEQGLPPELPDVRGRASDFPRRSTWKWTAGGIAVIVVIVLVRSALTSTSPPKLATSCTTPALVLSTAKTHRGATIRWSATGPANQRFLLAVGVARLVPGSKPGDLSPVPDAGLDTAHTQPASATRVFSSGCTASGAFTVGLPNGDYSVRLFRINGRGTATTGTPVATQHLAIS